MKTFKTNDNQVNMCDTCQWCISECCAVNIKFGDGLGGDNIIECDQYSGSEYEEEGK